MACPYCKHEKKKGLTDTVPRTRLPAGISSELATLAASVAAAGGLDAIDGVIPLWSPGCSFECSVADAEAAIGQTGGRGGKKPFRYATEKPDSTDRAVDEVLDGRPEAPYIPPKPVPPVPIHLSDGVFIEKDWEGWKQGVKRSERIKSYKERRCSPEMSLPRRSQITPGLLPSDMSTQSRNLSLWARWYERQSGERP